MIETGRKIRVAMFWVVGVVAMLFVAGGLGCRGPANSPRTATPVRPPALPQQFGRGTVQTTATTERITHSAIGVPQRTGTLSWIGSTNGWVAEVSYKKALTDTWQVVAYVTNQNWVIIPITDPQGFYAVTKMTDTDNPNNIITGK